jgi:hypothetical protein
MLLAHLMVTMLDEQFTACLSDCMFQLNLAQILSLLGPQENNTRRHCIRFYLT